MNTTKNLLDSMLRHGIGFDPNFFERIADAPNFPPHNIVQLSDEHFQLTLAVAGFRDDEIEIVLHQDILTVSGKKAHTALPETSRILYSGIAFRDFSRQFKVGEHVCVESATLADGLLQIDLERKLPDVMKPKRIPIGFSSLAPRLAA